MTPKEICEKIVEHGSCRGVSCTFDNCPLYRRGRDSLCLVHGKVEAAHKWLADHKVEEMTEERIRQIVQEEVALSHHGIMELVERRKEPEKGMPKECEHYNHSKQCFFGYKMICGVNCSKVAPSKQEPEYYTPEPGEDPCLPRDIPCFIGLENEYNNTIYYYKAPRSDGKFIVETHQGIKLKQKTSRSIWATRVRFRLSDIQDRGNSMVGKMVKAWDEEGKAPIIGWCDRFSGGLYHVRSADGGDWFHHARYYCECWEV